MCVARVEILKMSDFEVNTERIGWIDKFQET